MTQCKWLSHQNRCGRHFTFCHILHHIFYIEANQLIHGVLTHAFIHLATCMLNHDNLVSHVYRKLHKIIMDKKPNEIHENLIPTKLTTIPYSTNSCNTIKHKDSVYCHQFGGSQHHKANIATNHKQDDIIINMIYLNIMLSQLYVASQLHPS